MATHPTVSLPWRGFPGDPGAESITQYRDPIPGQETKIPLAAKQLSLPTTTRKSMGCNERSCMMQRRPYAVFNNFLFKVLRTELVTEEVLNGCWL